MLGGIMSSRPSTAAPRPTSHPGFPLYLLPSLRIPFRRRRISEPPSSASSSASEPPSLSASPTSPTSPVRHRLSSTQPRTLRCAKCSTDLAYHAQIISKCFFGRHGRAYLVTPAPAHATPSCPTPPAVSVSEASAAAPDAGLLNIRVAQPEDRQLATGAHTVADITCVVCGATVGWKYLAARSASQKYKVGKFILETGRVVGFQGWEDVPDGDADADGSWVDEGWGVDGAGAGHGDGDDNDVVVFDSEDEDECEDIFAGVWDASVVAKRRRSKALSPA